MAALRSLSCCGFCESILERISCAGVVAKSQITECGMSEWYEKSYSIFDKMYEKNKNDKITNKDKLSTSILKKIKSLFN